MAQEVTNDGSPQKNADFLNYTADVVGNLATIQVIEYQDYHRGSIDVQTGETTTTLTFYGSIDGVNYYPASVGGGSAITLNVAADNIYSLPSELEGFRYIKIVGNTSGVIDIHLKS